MQHKDSHGPPYKKKSNQEEECAKGQKNDQTRVILTTQEILDLLDTDPNALRAKFPRFHIDQSTIDIAVDWSNTSSCDGCLEQVADILRLSLEQL